MIIAWACCCYQWLRQWGWREQEDYITLATQEQNQWLSFCCCFVSVSPLSCPVCSFYPGLFVSPLNSFAAGIRFKTGVKNITIIPVLHQIAVWMVQGWTVLYLYCGFVFEPFVKTLPWRSVHCMWCTSCLTRMCPGRSRHKYSLPDTQWDLVPFWHRTALHWGSPVCVHLLCAVPLQWDKMKSETVWQCLLLQQFSFRYTGV